MTEATDVLVVEVDRGHRGAASARGSTALGLTA